MSKNKLSDILHNSVVERALGKSKLSIQKRLKFDCFLVSTLLSTSVTYQTYLFRHSQFGGLSNGDIVFWALDFVVMVACLLAIMFLSIKGYLCRNKQSLKTNDPIYFRNSLELLIDVIGNHIEYTPPKSWRILKRITPKKIRQSSIGSSTHKHIKDHLAKQLAMAYLADPSLSAFNFNPYVTKLISKVERNPHRFISNDNIKFTKGVAPASKFLSKNSSKEFEVKIWNECDIAYKAKHTTIPSSLEIIRAKLLCIEIRGTMKNRLSEIDEVYKRLNEERTVTQVIHGSICRRELLNLSESAVRDIYYNKYNSLDSKLDVLIK